LIKKKLNLISTDIDKQGAQSAHRQELNLICEKLIGYYPTHIRR